VAQLYTPRYWVPFSSPTTRNATAEVSRNKGQLKPLFFLIDRMGSSVKRKNAPISCSLPQKGFSCSLRQSQSDSRGATCERKLVGHKLQREAYAASARQNGGLPSLFAICNRPKVSFQKPSLRIIRTHGNANLIYKAVTQLPEMSKVSFHEQPPSTIHTAVQSLAFLSLKPVILSW
jgi:hypothetical protein